MERNMNNNDFEQFIKKNADQYRMYPSERVWHAIYSTLHTRRKWYGVGLSILLLSMIAVTWMIISPATKKLAVNPETINPDQNISSQKDQNEGANRFSLSQKNKTTLTSPINNTSGLLSFVPGEIKVENTSVGNPEQENIILNDENTDITQLTTKDNSLFNPTVDLTDQVIDNWPDMSNRIANFFSQNNDQRFPTYKEVYPLTIESVVNSYKAFSKNKRLRWEIFFTPTVSYRKLTENKSFLRNSSNQSYSYVSYSDVNSVVTHKPDMGLELGLTAKYPLTNSLRILGGIQFNISRYGIRVFNAPGEIATIALDQSSGVDSVAAWTTYRNFSGYNPDWLQNFYFSVSAPIGAELKLTSNKKTEFGIAGTIQPSYILGDRAFLISTDYKNYAEVPWLIRRWNMNTSFETYISYSTGKLKWQVGPQVRYQLLSSFQNKYPVKENLFDFGLKLGIMLNK